MLTTHTDQSLNANFEEELKARRKPTLDLDFPEEEKQQCTSIPTQTKFF